MQRSFDANVLGWYVSQVLGPWMICSLLFDHAKLDWIGNWEHEWGVVFTDKKLQLGAMIQLNSDVYIYHFKTLGFQINGNGWSRLNYMKKL
jgi:hypothetical protein